MTTRLEDLVSLSSPGAPPASWEAAGAVAAASPAAAAGTRLGTWTESRGGTERRWERGAGSSAGPWATERAALPRPLPPAGDSKERAAAAWEAAAWGRAWAAPGGSAPPLGL